MGGREVMDGTINDNPILLDTHVILWSLLQPEELDKSIKQTIENAQEQSQLFLSSISLWEIAMLKNKKRINIYEPLKDFLKAITDIEGMTIVDISADIAAESALLTDNFHGDPADRIITATAMTTGSVLLTRDSKILSWAERGNIRAKQV
jgi:PIN domain nuclease of toxin-antitoxin system